VESIDLGQDVSYRKQIAHQHWCHKNFSQGVELLGFALL